MIEIYKNEDYTGSVTPNFLKKIQSLTLWNTSFGISTVINGFIKPLAYLYVNKLTNQMIYFYLYYDKEKYSV